MNVEELRRFLMPFMAETEVTVTGRVTEFVLHEALYIPSCGNDPARVSMHFLHRRSDVLRWPDAGPDVGDGPDGEG